MTTDQRRAQLLGIGREVFASTPFDEVSMHEVAKRAGVSKGLLYHYFGDKRGYYQSVLEAVATELLHVTVFSPEVALDEAIQGVVLGFITYVLDNEPFYRALIRGGIGSDARFDAQLEVVRRTILARVRDRIGLPDEPLINGLLYGWLGFTEATVLDWLESRHLSPHALGLVLTRALLALVEIRP